jgi:exonuclease SbcC
VIRLVKLSIWDFKGLQGGPHAVEFDTEKYVSLLCGPNGYGKSTIFDAIELCLTGKVSRIEKSKDGKHEDARSVRHSKSPLHNNTTEPFKLELEFTVDVRKLTLKLEKSMGGRQERLNQYADGIELSLKEGDGAFKLFSDRQALMAQLDLTSIADTYQLLTYMSQDEADFFLRKRQQERQDWLSVLTNTDEQRDMLDKLEKYQKSLGRNASILSNKIAELAPSSVSDKTSATPYVDLLSHIKGVEKNAFDIQNPYAEVPLTSLDRTHESFMAEVVKLDRFANTFDLKEYEKYRKHTFLTAPLKEKNFTIALASKLLKIERSDDVKYAQRMHLLYKESIEIDKIKLFFVKDIITEETLSEYLSAYADYNTYSDILFFTDDDVNRDCPPQDVLKNLSNSAAVPRDELHEIAKALWLEYSKLSQSAANYSKLISKLATARDDLRKCQYDLDQHNKQSSDRCVYCGHNWQATENLISAYTEQSDLLENLLKGDGEKLKDIITTTQKTVIEPLKERCKVLQAMHDTYAYAYNGNANPVHVNVQEMTSQIEKVMPGFLQSHPSPKAPLKGNQFMELFSAYKKRLSGNINMDAVNFYNKIETADAQGINIEPYLTGLNRAGFETSLTSEAAFTAIGFEQYTRDLAEGLAKFAATFAYNPTSISSDNLAVLKKHFKEPGVILVEWLKAAKELLPTKQLYLSDQHALMRSKELLVLKSKYSKLKVYADDLAGTIKKCRKELRLYENSLTRALQIPFYVISARILQNSPHGEGGLVIKPQKDDDNSKSLIVGVPGETQDAVNQLSSGQLMVVALAFFLALNIRNRGSNAAKLLLLDDPVQDMDSLNSHALVDVLRREFTSESHKYQLITSTSSDIQMNLMKYKMRLSGDSIFKVQDRFFSVKEKDV